MPLDAFDQKVLSQHGYAQDIMKELYGADLSPGSAKCQLTGVRRHLRFKKKMEPPKQGELDERIYHSDGTWTTKRLIRRVKAEWKSDQENLPEPLPHEKPNFRSKK